MNRITLNTSPQEAIISMIDGNPGALTVCLQLMGGKGASLDEQAQGFADLCRMDDQEIYGSNIWVAYKDICGQNIELLKTKIRSYKLGDEVRKANRYVS